jgi:homogentisate 1,2-dioxygenase
MIFWTVKALLVNKDCTIGLAAPRNHCGSILKNADADEMIFIHKGKGNCTMMGNIPFEYGLPDYSKRGLSIKLILKQQLIACCMSNLRAIYTPKRYKMNQVNI